MTAHVIALRTGGLAPARDKSWMQVPSVAAPAFRADVLAGLSRAQKALPSKYLYDRYGSQLFERIVNLPEYYVARAEEALMLQAREELATLLPPRAQLIEYGAGALHKVRMLLELMVAPAAYIPIDISADHLATAARDLATTHPRVPVRPMVADFTKPMRLDLGSGPRVGFFPGSTIGNFAPEEAELFLQRVASQLGFGGTLLIGVDVKKDSRILWDAYNDSEGVTAAFNRNLLTRINREIGAGFNPDRFTHYAPYDEAEGRVEMHLISQDTQSVHVAGHLFCFRRGESIHTENSYKYGVLEFRSLARRAGFRPVRTWNNKDFSVHFLRVG